MAETLNLSRLPGYTTGGTIHVIVNNQLGFTTGPEDSYSTSYASGLARGFKIPIVHVNADDPEACVEAARLAIAYRETFERDFLIDLIGYRRHGHNEGDEPAFTQPLMYRTIDAHPTVREIWARTLVERGTIARETADDDEHAAARGAPVRDGVARSRSGISSSPNLRSRRPRAAATRADARPARAAARHQREPARRAGRLHVPSQAASARASKRGAALEAPDERTIDWAHGEELALASILADGTAVRLTGEDVERGTFSHRHAVYHDAKTGRMHVPLQSFPQAQAAFEIHNTPAHRERGRRLRVRLQHPGAVAAGDLGSAVRRLHQRRAGDDRRVHRLGARQVGDSAVARAAAAARARGPGARSRERAPRAVPPALRRPQHARRQLHDRGAVLPPAPPAGGAAATSTRCRSSC